MTRKEFIQKTGLATAGLCGLGLTLSLEGCSGIYVKGTFENNTAKVSKEELAKSDRGYSILRHDRFPGPVFLQKGEKGKYLAVLMVCTHARCEVYPSGDKLVCPCHGSEFSTQGKVLLPPAEDDLYQYSTTTHENHVEIHLV